jgi:hypothetical protein
MLRVLANSFHASVLPKARARIYSPTLSSPTFTRRAAQGNYPLTMLGSPPGSRQKKRRERVGVVHSIFFSVIGRRPRTLARLADRQQHHLLQTKAKESSPAARRSPWTMKKEPESFDRPSGVHRYFGHRPVVGSERDSLMLSLETYLQS